MFSMTNTTCLASVDGFTTANPNVRRRDSSFASSCVPKARLEYATASSAVWNRWNRLENVGRTTLAICSAMAISMRWSSSGFVTMGPVSDPRWTLSAASMAAAAPSVSGFLRRMSRMRRSMPPTTPEIAASMTSLLDSTLVVPT